MSKELSHGEVLELNAMRAAIAEVWPTRADCRAVERKLAAVSTTDLLTLSYDEVNQLIPQGEKKLTSSSLRALQEAIHWCRIDVCVMGRTPVVFSAPHTLVLQRDGEPDHKVEESTATLARDFARSCGGGFVTWKEAERERVRSLRGPCPTNRDPNYLHDGELRGSAWLAALRQLREQLAPSGGVVTRPCLHVDVHGIRNPPTHPADLLVGTDAMRRHLGDSRTDALCARIEAELRPVLRKLPVPTSMTPVAAPAAASDAGGSVGNSSSSADSDHDASGACMELHVGGPSTPAPALGGDWGAGSERSTLTQLSTDSSLWLKCASDGSPPSSCFTHALQLEMSLRLRRHLAAHRTDREAFAAALVAIARGI